MIGQGSVAGRLAVMEPRWWATVLVDVADGDTRAAALERRFGPKGVLGDADLIVRELSYAPAGPPARQS